MNFLTSALPAVIVYCKEHDVHFSWGDFEPFIILFILGFGFFSFIEIIIRLICFTVEFFKSKKGGD